MNDGGFSGEDCQRFEQHRAVPCAVDRRILWDTIAQLHDRIKAGDDAQMPAMTTCAYKFTDARTVVPAAMNDCRPESQEVANR